MNGKEGTCPTPWKGLTGFCDKMGDECGMDFHCPGNQKCCFSGCQQMCVNTSEVHKKADTNLANVPNLGWVKKGCVIAVGICVQKILIAKEVSSVASMAAKRTVLILVGNISSSSLYSQDDKLGHISD